jgi:hypothetical protein
MRAFCSTGDRIVSDSRCVTWVQNAVASPAPDASVAVQTMRTWCAATDNLKRDECRQLAQSTNSWLWYDDLARNYCNTATGRADAFCGCMNAPSDLNQQIPGFRPACNWGPCLDPRAYVPTSMKTTTGARDCPTSLTICDQSINISEAQRASLQGITFSCAQASTSVPTAPTGTSGPSGPSAPTGPTEPTGHTGPTEPTTQTWPSVPSGPSAPSTILGVPKLYVAIGAAVVLLLVVVIGVGVFIKYKTTQ